MFDTSPTRNQRWSDAEIGAFPCALIWVLCLGLFLLSADAKAAPVGHSTRQQTEVLFLSSADPDLPDVASMIEQTETRILDGSDTPVHFSFEYLDSASSLADPSRSGATASYLLKKHRGQTFDLLIAINEETLALAEQIRAKLSPDAALLFFVANPQNLSNWLNQKQRTTGVIRNLNYLPTLQLALQQNPGTNRVIVVSGSSDGEKLAVKIAREQFRVYESNLEFQYLTDLQFSELGPRLANVQPDAIIVFLDFITDSRGENFVPARILPGIAKTSNRPIYGTFSSVVGAGVVGGSVADMGEVGQILGNDAVRILRGESLESIPVITRDFQHYAIDWRQLHRWGISENQVPKGSEVRYWEYSPWELYRWRILGLSTLVLIETLLIVLLLRNITKRKHAQGELRGKEKELGEAQRLARVGNWQWDPKKGTFTGSEELYRILGLDPKLSLPSYENLEQIFSPESRVQLSATLDEALKTGTVRELDLELVRADHSNRWVTVGGEALRDGSGRVTNLRGTIQDITERKHADEARFNLASIVESSDDAIISQTLDGIIVSWNLGAQHIFGFSEADAVGQSINIIVPSELWEEAEAIRQKAKIGEKVEHYETVRVTKGRQEINVSLTTSPLKDATGRIVGASTIARDITQRKRAEQDLKKSEERFSKAFRQSPMALSLIGAKTHRYLDVNETFERLTGYARADMIGKSAIEIGLWVNPAERARLTQRLLVENSVHDVECEWRNKDGSTLVASASEELIEIDGEPCILAVVADITDRRVAQQALLESERRFRLMADSAPMLIWLSGPDKFRTDFNKAWLTFTGRVMQQELGEGWTENIHPDDLHRYLETYAHAFGEKEKFISEYRMRRPDGSYRWMLDQAAPRFLDGGTFAGYVGCCMDISDQKDAKAALVELSGRLIQAGEEERVRVARELHDDINQRLALLANRVQECEQAASAKNDPVQTRELRTLWQLINEIATDIQHMSHQLHPSKLHYLGLAATVRDLCHEVSQQHKIEVECVVRDLPRDLEETASLSLFRTVQESLRNVVKHSQARHVKVQLTCQSTVVRLLVSDDGVGFNPQYASSNHGLGLVSMRERLRSAGGEFSIWSKPLLGTQVEGTVPAKTRPVRRTGEAAADKTA